MAYNETPTKGHAMRSDMDDLVDLLKSNPGQVFVNDTGTAAFMLVGPEQQLMIATCLSKNFHEMTETEFNEFLQNLLK